MQIHTLRACFLLAIPPPPERVPPQGGFPTNLSELNLLGWATLVQDVVAGLQARSIQVRVVAERQARAQLVQCPRGLVQPTQTQPPAALRTPQVVPPLCQPPPGWPATQYQQVVQPPGKSTGREVMFDPSTDKTTPTGSPSSQDHGRPTTRRQGDSGQSVSCPRGVQEMVSVQPLCQEGDLPSGSTPNVPPPAAPERTLPQQGGQPKTSHHNPVQLVAKFCSTGWKKDLEHVLRVYYKYNTASFKEVEWVRLKDKFFTYFLPHKEETLGIKERCSMDYMVCIEEHF